MSEHSPSGDTPVVPPTAFGINGNGKPPDPSLNVREMLGYAVDRLDDLREAESRRIDGILEIRAYYEEKLALAETKRIDAIRAVDVNSVSVANEKATQQAQVLANQVVQSAEALRVLVASTAETALKAQQQIAGALSDRVAALEQAQYTGAGKQSVTDPAQAALLERIVAELKALGTSKDLIGGTRSGRVDAFQTVRNAVLLAIAIGGFLLGNLVLK